MKLWWDPWQSVRASIVILSDKQLFFLCCQQWCSVVKLQTSELQGLVITCVAITVSNRATSDKKPAGTLCYWSRLLQFYHVLWGPRRNKENTAALPSTLTQFYAISVLPWRCQAQGWEITIPSSITISWTRLCNKLDLYLLGGKYWLLQVSIFENWAIITNHKCTFQRVLMTCTRPCDHHPNQGIGHQQPRKFPYVPLQRIPLPPSETTSLLNSNSIVWFGLWKITFC